MTTFWQILTIIGSIGVFLVGIKMMSESLQKVAGNRMRSILSAITANKYRSVLTGLVVTAVIQSSSATSVIIISFVNAGLLSVYQAIGALVGANIGTTLTLWIISLLGFKISLDAILLPLIALSIPLYFSSKGKFKFWGEFIFGFALLFLGLELMKANLPVLDENSLILQDLALLTEKGFISRLIFVVVGMVFAFFLQSSSVTLALTLVMCNNGWIEFEMGAAMVLGANIGTTSTAIFASLIANRTARKAALSHVLFNMIGVFLAMLLFNSLINGVSMLARSIEGSSPLTDINSVPVALSLLHTLFNVITAVMIIALMPQFIKLLGILVPESRASEQFKLTYFTSPINTSELSVLQAGKEIHVFGKRTEAMLDFIPQLLIEKNEDDFKSLFERIQQYEDISDRMEEEIASYLTRLSESELSFKSSKKIRAMLKIIDDMESINDICMKMAVLISKKNDDKAWFSQKMRNEVGTIFDKVRESICLMNQHIEDFERPVNMAQVLELEESINTLRTDLWGKNQKRLKAEKIQHATARYFSEFISLFEEVGDHTINISQAIAEYQRD
jgi:phosphate:Na+ symporter